MAIDFGLMLLQPLLLLDFRSSSSHWLHKQQSTDTDIYRVCQLQLVLGALWLAISSTSQVVYTDAVIECNEDASSIKMKTTDGDRSSCAHVGQNRVSG